MTYKYIKRHIPIRAATVALSDIKKIVTDINVYVDRERDALHTNIDDNKEIVENEKDHLKQNISQAFRIAVTIVGDTGEEIFGYGPMVFEDPELPEVINTIFISNEAPHQTISGRKPNNRFSLHFDFSTPPLLDPVRPVSQPTLNASNLFIEGEQDEWVKLVQEAVMEVLRKRSNRRGIIHVAFMYDIVLAVVIFPLSLYVAWRASSLVEVVFDSMGPLVKSAAYLYIVFMILWVYRILFGYTKWAFPSVELKHSESKSAFHRKAWYVISLSIAATALYDTLSF